MADADRSTDEPSPLTRLLRRRRMTRSFAGGPSFTEINSLCSEALRAPSAGFSQGVHLVILRDDDLADFWAESGAGRWFAGRSDGVLQATTVVLVCGDQQAYLDRYAEPDKVGLGLDAAENWAVPYWLTDAAMVAENLLLLVEERRWGALFFGMFADGEAYLRQLGVPPTVHCIGAVAIGFRDPRDRLSGSPSRRPRDPATDHLHEGHW
ncbi:MAG: nitroreductase family protein [Actinomycetota bacterium]